MKKLILIFSILLTSSIVLAQKFGHINTQQLLLVLPEYSEAQIELENYQKEKLTEFNQLKEMYMAKEKAYMDKEAKSKADPNSFPPELLKQDYNKLMESAQKLEDLQYEIEGDIQQRESILINAIINKIKAASEAVAKEKGYTYIFDSSSLLFAGGDDLNEAIKLKLTQMRTGSPAVTPAPTPTPIKK